MVDRSNKNARPDGRLPPLLDRLRTRVVLLVCVAFVLAALVVEAGLGWPEAVLALLILIIAALWLPITVSQHQEHAPGDAPGVIATMGVDRFADVLLDPCLVLDRRSVVRHRNAAAAQRFPNIAIGNPITFVLRYPELVKAIEAVWQSGETRLFELHETLPSETWEKVAISPLQSTTDPNGETTPPLLLITFQSLTDLKRVDAMRSDFIANASHELRTPLTSLLGFIDTLLGPAARDTAAREKFLHIMRGQAERMAKLIEDLLSLSRIEMHQHVRPTGSVDLVALLRDVREGLQAQAEAAEVELRLAIPAETTNAIGDRDELYEVFENLVENAIKYGGSGNTVDIELAVAALPGFTHLVSIVDHGPGVEPEHVPRLTERFYRIDADASRRKKGTGLGLAIAKHTVNRHRGQLTIRSRPGHGMRVDVSLP
ncbi:ATP-binding protein [Devosia rhodophyticola]|uniref:histidine kinase n=1 Tax=Devosia rhodophyticola TaxID=3026423 RepID=A0ABY7YZY2_9HYPH|nr:ATP-binding protein [Devosia rhodophyticola]WDR06732.1 ATP-binding protein [Devosia rhodophyticola]